MVKIMFQVQSSLTSLFTILNYTRIRDQGTINYCIAIHASNAFSTSIPVADSRKNWPQIHNGTALYVGSISKSEKNCKICTEV